MTFTDRLELWFGGRRRAAAQAIFFRSLATLLNAGVPLSRSLDVLTNQVEYAPLRKALPVYVNQLMQGKALSRVLSQPTGLFSQLQLQLVSVGESTGGLHDVLERLASESEKSNALWMKIRSALTYPVLVLVLSLVLVIWAQNVVFKDLLGFLTTLGVELPWSTRLLSFSSKILTSPWAFVLVVLLAGAVVWVTGFLASRLDLQRRLWAVAFELPGLGTMLRTAVAVEFCRALSITSSAGVPILRGLELSAAATANPLVRERVARARAAVAEGVLVADALKETDLFPPMMIHLLSAGETTGKLAFLLERCAAVCEESMDQAIEMATAALQPAVMLVVGVLVGFIIWATLGPMLKVVESL